MSKKTRKEKIAAEQRRKTQLTYSPTHIPSPLVSDPKANFQPKMTFSLNQAQTSPQAKATMDYSYVLSDLRRIFVLAGVAFCAQIVLWYLLGNRV